ncbi:MAG TPA: flagellar hook-basal body protein [Candidatus Methylacidiphilales bacterium]|jgi:flagellar basal body rod protein FlgG|nr:flagellar hook-basal body protein [Candidatus Methylacidiphilales bacterium]
MNVGLYSSAAGMRMGEASQDLATENLSLQSVPGYRQSFPVFTTDPTMVSTEPGVANSGNPAAVRMTRMTDFSQGPVTPSADPYHLAIQGQAFFEVKEADGSTSYTRDGAFTLSPTGKLLTSDGAQVLSQGGAPVTINSANGGTPSIGPDGSIQIGGEKVGSIGLVHFKNPSTSLQPAAFGRYVAPQNDAKQGLAANDQVLQGKLEGSNGNPVSQMADMIQAVRLYEANQKTIQAADDNQNQLINTLGGRPQA